MLSRKALELIGMVEGSPAAGVASAASLPPVKQSSAAPGASDLLAVSQQLQLQQQQVQQQLEELRQMKAAALSLQKAPAERSQVEEHEDLDHVDPPSDPPTRPLLPRKKSKASMSLAAETAEASKSEANHGNIEAVKIQEATTATTPAPKAVPAAKAYAKSKEVDEDSNHLQAPKDFPAALRGGWQGLLAKKRAEGFKKSSAKVEEHSSIMDLMQTPKTYTAWLRA